MVDWRLQEILLWRVPSLADVHQYPKHSQSMSPVWRNQWSCKQRLNVHDSFTHEYPSIFLRRVQRPVQHVDQIGANADGSAPLWQYPTAFR